MEQQNPTAGDSGASTPDPIDRIEAFLAAQDGDTTGQPDNTAGGDGQPTNAAKTPDDPKDGAPAKDSEPQFTTAHLAAYLGVDESEIDVDADGQPVFKTKIDGKESTAKFADIRKSHQLGVHAENRTREAAAKEQAAERKMQEAEQAIQARFQHAEQQMQQLAEIAQIQQQDLAADYNAVDWPALWQTDPGRAGILRDQFQAKAARIQQALQNVGQKREVAQRQAIQQQQDTARKRLESESQRLVELVPEWRDKAVAAKEQGALAEWAIGRGYDSNYLSALHMGQVPNTAVVIRDMRAAWQHDTLQKSRPAVENLVRTAPKLVKPGQAPQSDGNAATLRNLKQNVKTSSGGNSAKAVAEWLLATGKA